MKVFINQKKVELSPQKIIGKGGEAEVYAINQKEVAKIFKTPNHLDFSQDIEAQKSAAERIQEHQQKLSQFPTNLPTNILAPKTLIRNSHGEILGYTMSYLQRAQPLYRYGDRRFREQNGITQNQVTKLFIELHKTLTKLHQQSIVVGDFNDLNILVQNNIPYFIDTDSWQFNPFFCQLFTARFVDPLLCDQTLNYPQLTTVYNADSDWYAFTVMLFRSLLYVEPYGGIYKDKNIPQAARPLHRITVFNEKVKYPKPALSYKILNDYLLDCFRSYFEKDQRGIFPLHLLNGLKWKNCSNCGEIHSHQNCPFCQIKTVLKPLPEFSNLHNIFSTKGSILATDITDHHCHYLYWENGEFKRETGEVVFRGDRSPFLNFWLNGDRTYVGQSQTVLSFRGGQVQPEETLQGDMYRQQPCFQSNQSQRYWLSQGKLWCDGTLGRDYVGDVLAEQTQFWLGRSLGFGFYQLGSLLTGFIFSVQRHGINDQITLPKITGEILAANCEIGCDIWLFLVVQKQSKIQHHLYVIDATGNLHLSQILEPLDLPSIEGHCPTETGLLVATDQGLEEWSIVNGQLQKRLHLSTTNSFTQANQTIKETSHSLYFVDAQHINQLRQSN
ncbi:MAG: hypothetical protein WBB82_01200 [Limnothrix sp.]